jgi:hypothetical protein
MGNLTQRLAHVRWIAGGTGAGKSTVAQILATRTGAAVYDGDRAERDWVSRCTQRDHPHFFESVHLGKAGRATRSPAERFRRMPSRHGETIGFVIEDLLELPTDRPILVDWFGNAPRYVAPLLSWPQQAVFLLPTREFRERALGTRFADPARARANWGTADARVALANRLTRDDLWDAEVREQAEDLGLPVIDIDGTRDAGAVADSLARQFKL